MVFTGYDYSTGLAALGQGLNNISKGFEQQHKQQSLAALGKEVQAGNFDSAAQKAFALGDAGTGLGILKLGQAAKQQALQQEASRSFMSGLGGGAAANPAISGLGQQAGGGAPSPGGGGPIASAPFTSEAQSSGLHVTSAYRGPDHPLTRANPNSPHAQGMAWDLRARTPEEADATISKQRELLTARGLVEGRDYRIIDEVRNPTRHATGPHIHVQLTPEGKARAGAGQQAAPVQVAQAPGGPQADMPAQGAANAQGYAIPQGVGSDIPPNDPAPRMSTQALMAAQANPNLPQAQRDMAKAIVERRLRYSDENSPLKTETLRLQNEKARRDLQGEGAVPLTAEERKQFGIPEQQAAYKTRSGEIKFGPAGTTIRNEGNLPPGYRASRDAQGNIERLEAIPGSEAYQKAEAQTEKDRQQKAMLAQTGLSVFSALDDIDRTSASSRFPVAGGMAGVLANIPGTGAHNVAQSLNTIRANISFERLNQMRQASPTGGALGAVSDSEQRLLSNSLAALEQSQDKKQFANNLKRVRAAFEKVVHGKVLTADERAAAIKAREDEIRGEEAPKGNAPPKRGELVDGHRYKGGDPADPNSWVRVR